MDHSGARRRSAAQAGEGARRAAGAGVGAALRRPRSALVGARRPRSALERGAGGAGGPWKGAVGSRASPEAAREALVTGGAGVPVGGERAGSPPRPTELRGLRRPKPPPARAHGDVSHIYDARAHERKRAAARAAAAEPWAELAQTWGGVEGGDRRLGFKSRANLTTADMCSAGGGGEVLSTPGGGDMPPLSEALEALWSSFGKGQFTKAAMGGLNATGISSDGAHQQHAFSGGSKPSGRWEAVQLARLLDAMVAQVEAEDIAPLLAACECGARDSATPDATDAAAALLRVDPERTALGAWAVFSRVWLEAARQTKTHCAERGALLEHLRARVGALLGLAGEYIDVLRGLAADAVASRASAVFDSKAAIAARDAAHARAALETERRLEIEEELLEARQLLADARGEAEGKAEFYAAFQRQEAALTAEREALQRELDATRHALMLAQGPHTSGEVKSEDSVVVSRVVREQEFAQLQHIENEAADARARAGREAEGRAAEAARADALRSEAAQARGAEASAADAAAELAAQAEAIAAEALSRPPELHYDAGKTLELAGAVRKVKGLKGVSKKKMSKIIGAVFDGVNAEARAYRGEPEPEPEPKAKKKKGKKSGGSGKGKGKKGKKGKVTVEEEAPMPAGPPTRVPKEAPAEVRFKTSCSSGSEILNPTAGAQPATASLYVDSMPPLAVSKRWDWSATAGEGMVHVVMLRRADLAVVEERVVDANTNAGTWELKAVAQKVDSTHYLALVSAHWPPASLGLRALEDALVGHLGSHVWAAVATAPAIRAGVRSYAAILSPGMAPVEAAGKEAAAISGAFLAELHSGLYVATRSDFIDRADEVFGSILHDENEARAHVTAAVAGALPAVQIAFAGACVVGDTDLTRLQPPQPAGKAGKGGKPKTDWVGMSGAAVVNPFALSRAQFAVVLTCLGLPLHWEGTWEEVCARAASQRAVIGLDGFLAALMRAALAHSDTLEKFKYVGVGASLGLRAAESIVVALNDRILPAVPPSPLATMPAPGSQEALALARCERGHRTTLQQSFDHAVAGDASSAGGVTFRAWNELCADVARAQGGARSERFRPTAAALAFVLLTADVSGFGASASRLAKGAGAPALASAAGLRGGRATSSLGQYHAASNLVCDVPAKGDEYELAYLGFVTALAWLAIHLRAGAAKGATNTPLAAAAALEALVADGIGGVAPAGP